jgi:hypothetical protein
LQQPKDIGIAVWLDDLSRAQINSGELAALVEQGVVGVTTRPSSLKRSDQAPATKERCTTGRCAGLASVKLCGCSRTGMSGRPATCCGTGQRSTGGQLRRQISSLSSTANVVQRTSGVIAAADIGSTRAAVTAVAEVDANIAAATAVLSPIFLRPKKTAGKPAKPPNVSDQQPSAMVLMLPG